MVDIKFVNMQHRITKRHISIFREDEVFAGETYGSVYRPVFL